MTLAERRDRLGLFAFRLLVRAFAAAGTHRALARFCARYVAELRDGRRHPAAFASAADGRITVLALDYERFRGDVDLFAADSGFRILIVSWNLLRHLLAAYVRPPTDAENLDRPGGRLPRVAFAEAPAGSALDLARQRFRAFLRRFLPAFLGGFGVDVVMNSDFRYRREMDFTRVAAELGIAHVCYYREAMYIVPANYHFAVERHRAFAPFRGTVIAVQNEITRRMFLEAGLAPQGRIAVRGCPRMDGYLQRIGNSHRQAPEAHQVAWFSSPSGVTLEDLSYFDLLTSSCSAVRALAELARDDPSLRVVLKMKDKHRGQLPRLREVVAEAGGGTPPANVEFVTERMAAHDVLLASRVVVCMQSTVVLEAAIAGLPVLLTHFRELRGRAGAGRALMYQECRAPFDVPEDAEDLKRLVVARLDDPVVAEGVMRQRRALFAEHVSTLEGGATLRSLALIRDAARAPSQAGALAPDTNGSPSSHDETTRAAAV